MFIRKRGLLLLAIVLLSTWLSYMYFKSNSSPILIWSQWVTAVETRDVATIERLSEWNGQSVDTKVANSVIQTLHSNPEWKQKIYHELQQQAVKLARKENSIGSDEQQPWFQLTRKAGQHVYKVSVPSFYFSIAGSYNSLLLSVNQQLFTVADQTIGPFVATDTDVQLIYQHKIGDIEERYQLGISEIWGEDEVQLLPTSMYSSFILRSNYAGGDLFIDHQYAGEIRAPTRIEPLAFKRHNIRLERNLPWGVIQSDRIVVEPDQKEVTIPLTLVNDTLIKQLGETLIQYNMSWSTAVRTSNAQQLNVITPELRQHLKSIIYNQTGKAQFAGNFVQVLIDPDSIELSEPSYYHFEAKLVAREDYAAGRWENENGEYITSYEPQRYWEYELTYSPESGWLVARYNELKQDHVNNREWQAFHAQRVLRIGVDAGLPPFESIKYGELYGFDVELMQWLGEKMNVIILFEERPWNQIVGQFDIDGDLDGAISAIDESLAQEVKDVLITDPYYADERYPNKNYVILLRQDLERLYEEMNQRIQELHSEYELEYNEMKERYF